MSFRMLANVRSRLQQLMEVTGYDAGARSGLKRKLAGRVSMSQGLTRRKFLAGAGAAAASLPFVNVGSVFGSAERPNFVFILTDDQRYDAMSCAGHPFLCTPNMDRIAGEGARLTNAFVTTSLCSPSRASFLTGRYAHSHGIRDNRTHFSDDIPTFPQVLQKGGYETAFIGKWHMDGQEGPRPGFDRWVALKGQGPYFNPTLNFDGEKEKIRGYTTDVLTNYAVDWLKQPRKSPFCLYLSHKAVHGPWTPPVRHSKLFEDVPVTRPASMDDNLEGKPGWFEERLKTHHGTKGGKEYEDFIRNYNRMLVGVDISVGRVLSALEDLGVLDNTVVVFTSDNGYFHGEHKLLDKRAMYEESIRIPLVVRYPPVIRPGTLIHRMVLNIDICPTFLDLADAEIPDGVQGRSIRPLLQGRTSGWRSDWLYEYWHERPYATSTIRGVRTERWKYIEYPETEYTSELYDLKNDRVELRNLINDSACAGVLADMRSRLQRLLVETK